MNSFYVMAMGMVTRGRELMVFDWDKAAQLIKDSGEQYAAAGLCGDWDYTCGTIYADGEPVTDSYTFLSSTWATPQLQIGYETIDCYRMQSDTPGWGDDTKWPKSALAILNQDIEPPEEAGRRDDPNCGARMDASAPKAEA